jgi:D-psicose/D-tagatose/L-ribulose 3-epimerase
MAVFPQTVHTWMFGDLPMEQITEYLLFAGAEGVDLSISLTGRNSPEELMGKDFRALFADAGLSVLTATPLFFSQEADLSSADPAIRESAVSFAKMAVDTTAFYGCGKMLISPSWVSVTHKLEKPYAEHWKLAVESTQQVAEYAAEKKVVLMVEPINRYRVSLIHTVDEGLRFIRDAGMGNLALVTDIFHMHMEEADGVVNALYAAAPKLECVHIGDSTRKCPGFGVTDWAEILRALRSVGFSGPLSYEPVELYFSEQQVAQDKAYAQAFAGRLKYGISYLKMLMETL